MIYTLSSLITSFFIKKKFVGEHSYTRYRWNNIIEQFHKMSIIDYIVAAEIFKDIRLMVKISLDLDCRIAVRDIKVLRVNTAKIKNLKFMKTKSLKNQEKQRS